MNVARSAGTGTDSDCLWKMATALTLFVPRLDGERGSFKYEVIRNLSGLTFEVSWRQRHDARPALQIMHACTVARAWWHAVGSQLDRMVRPQRCP